MRRRRRRSGLEEMMQEVGPCGARLEWSGVGFSTVVLRGGGCLCCFGGGSLLAGNWELRGMGKLIDRKESVVSTDK